ncbi:hypothetical protein RND71_039910 [Anisodus tanguticus]|uniref:F-box/LRR-repeat protein 15/At3g58940/PEG3-like LRR domain-containing protein n=1 Tax=Anisodus tanguticus TaxID=243964 RepID=A0AAE1UY09_9SOLA|nr:hypothetical protein RND71_039910 [Anisodus tanguticus]
MDSGDSHFLDSLGAFLTLFSRNPFTRRPMIKAESFRHLLSMLSFTCIIGPNGVVRQLKRSYCSQSADGLLLLFRKKVENVVLWSDCSERDNIDLPQSICICKSLITLDLSCCYFDKELVIDWKSLKILKLKYTDLHDEDMVNLLSCCPALETLDFSSVSGFRRLEVTSSNLKRLKFKDYWLPNDDDHHSLEVVAPHIQHLEISEDLYDLKYEHQLIRTLVREYLQKLSYITDVEDVSEDLEKSRGPFTHSETKGTHKTNFAAKKGKERSCPN